MLGGVPIWLQGYNNGDQDFSAVLNLIKCSGADLLITYMTLSPDLGIFTQQMKQQATR